MASTGCAQEREREFGNSPNMASNGKDDQADVVAIPTEISVKHPLQNAWVLWFDNPVKRLGAKDWSSNLKKVCFYVFLAVYACTLGWGKSQARICAQNFEPFCGDIKLPLDGV